MKVCSFIKLRTALPLPSALLKKHLTKVIVNTLFETLLSIQD